MSDVYLKDSDMTFGPYSEENFFHIEKSDTYKNHHMQQDLMMAEFLLIRVENEQNSEVWVVEGKKSAPNPKNPNPKRPDRFDEFIGEITEKLSNAFILGIAMCLLRHKSKETKLPEPFQKLNFSVTNFRLVLVINGHQDEWLIPIKDELNKSLRLILKMWALPPTSVAVINDTMAREKRLII